MKPKKKLKLYEFDVYIAPKKGETPEKMGQDVIPAYSLAEAKKILRTIRTHSPKIAVFKRVISFSDLSSVAKEDFRRKHKFYKTALKRYKKLGIGRWTTKRKIVKKSLRKR